MNAILLAFPDSFNSHSCVRGDVSSPLFTFKARFFVQNVHIGAGEHSQPPYIGVQ
jgi:hypothetical protein